MEFTSTSESLPADGRPVVATRILRYKHYKPSSQQAKKGMVGRWQEFNGYGWDNCEPPEGWSYMEELNK